MNRADTTAAIRRAAHPIAADDDVSALVDAVGDARFVLLGEASHGTAEFYRIRAALTRRLVEERGFDAVAVEADWPAALQASRWAQGGPGDIDGMEGTAGGTRHAEGTVGGKAQGEGALGGFGRFPRWMWRNAEVVTFLSWLRHHNLRLADRDARIGFFGLDLYSLRESIDAVLQHLDREDPEAAKRARARYACLDDLAHDPQAYGHAVVFGLRPDCERDVLRQLADMQRRAGERLHADGELGDERFYAEQNARVVANAEVYYRSMFSGRTDSWNVRDEHMGETLELLAAHLERRRGRPARIVVWAHNSHLGDARATDVTQQGQLNLGQLVREAHTARETFLLGFTTHTGTVTAADDWDMPWRTKRVLPSRPDSIERLLHDVGLPRYALDLRTIPQALRNELSKPLLERAIGVIYRPDTERWSHYFGASLARQFDAVVHVDVTTALRALDAGVPADAESAPIADETWPSGV